VTVTSTEHDGLLLRPARGEQVLEEVAAHLGDTFGQQQSVLEGRGFVADPGGDPADRLPCVGITQGLVLEVFLIEPSLPLRLRLVVNIPSTSTLIRVAIAAQA